jgi:hypothetical protein
MDLRSNTDGAFICDTSRSNTTPAFGELRIGTAAAFVTASLSAATEVIDAAGGTSGASLMGSSFGLTADIATGTFTIIRSGLYELELNLASYTNSLAAGNVTIAVEKNGTALAQPDAVSETQVAATSATLGRRHTRIVSLIKGDVLRVTVTNSAAGGTVSILNSTFRVRQLADSIIDKVAGV